MATNGAPVMYPENLGMVSISLFFSKETHLDTLEKKSTKTGLTASVYCTYFQISSSLRGVNYFGKKENIKKKQNK